MIKRATHVLSWAERMRRQISRAVFSRTSSTGTVPGLLLFVLTVSLTHSRAILPPPSNGRVKVVREAEFCTPAERPGKNAERQTAHLAFSSLPTGVGAPGDERALEEIDRLIDAGKLQEASEKLADQVRAQGESHRTFFLEAKILFREQKYRESLKTLERCLALNQQDADVFKLVASNAILISRVDIAETALKKAIQVAPDDYLAHFHLGALYYTDSRFPLAEPVLRKAVKLNPEFVPARLFLGLALEELEGEEEAIQCYRQAIELTERFKVKGEQPYLYLGRLLYRQNHFPESLPYLEKAVEANPQSCEGLCLMARVFTTQGREKEAMEALAKCVKADPRYAEAHYLLSRAYVKQGRHNEAQKEMQLFQGLKLLEKKEFDPRRGQRRN
jgi:tetratricopeptide (TPR) repeat protein